MKLNLSADLALIISIITVFLFANGNAFLGGYLSVFNLDPVVLNYSVQDKIYLGYIRGFNYLMYALLITFILMVIRYILISLGVSKKLNTYLEKKLNTTPKKFTPQIHNSSYHEELESSYSRNSTLGVLVMVILIATLFALAHTESDAKNAAFEALKNKTFDSISIKSSKEKDTHFEILCGSSVCAIIDKANNVSLEDSKNILFKPRNPDENLAP